MSNPAGQVSGGGTSDSSEKTFTCGSLIYTKRGLITMFAWMLWGDFCFTLMEAVVPSVMPLKLHSLNAPDTLISVIMTSLPAIFNFTITPTIGMWSDRLRTRWGRRMPFIIGTLPFLTLSLVFIGLSDSIGAWAHQHFFAASGFDQAKVTIILLAVFVGLFELFNMFVNTVYWYLFNDIVPEKMMGRFMSQFRLVGTLAGMFYNFFIFQFAESHMKEIYLGAAGVYLVGFGIVCLKVREGTYPPLEDLGPSSGFFASLTGGIRSFWSECFTSRYYWCFMLDPAISCLAAFGPFFVFFQKSMGLTLGNIGFMGGLGQATMLICFLFVGSLVDRWHPVRASAYLSAWLVFTAFSGWVWLLVGQPNPMLYLWITAISGALFSPLFNTINQVAGMSRWMRLLPREKLGQFSGAMCLVRAVAIFSAGFIAGGFLDLVKSFNPPTASDPEGLFGYRYMFVFSGIIAVAAFIFHYKVYRGWKRLGGDTAYEAPNAGVAVHKLPPFAGDDGRVHKGLLLVVGWSFLGSLLGWMAWIGYYTWWEKNPFYTMVFAIGAAILVVLFIAYLRFIKFMERP
jgi:maltose/moltooligosaccharide transporter